MTSGERGSHDDRSKPDLVRLAPGRSVSRAAPRWLRHGSSRPSGTT